MIPESKLIRSELTIRDMALPDDILLARKSLIRWLALSFGMIMPNESRRLLLDILEALIELHLKQEHPTTKDILLKLESNTKSKQNPKAVYYHLQRLQTHGILSRKKGIYSIGDGEEKSLKEIFRDIYAKKADAAFLNMDKALEKLENSYRA
ncbi:hypothetical protein KKF81_00010 [Candidatus Micrarchaeota archaeon]|nr:hypothetical protein [Candidatus Micrarchaeota archaeon]MBU1165300.1 hypothetical protein [Candidatus Micrarchaeota archaeon]MBU1886144.1 hypothetical protein [Candidatus Micrarchaeota archaeon]